jgi:hypothetical protein
MSFDATRVQERRLPDGTSFDVYVPIRPAARLLVTVIPVIDGVAPRSEGVEAPADFADDHGYLVLSTCFDAESGFHLLGVGGSVRHDLVVLQMIADVATEYDIPTDRVSLFGYSAGGQFAHRFLYVHPERLEQVVVGAPGAVTLPHADQAWPRGVADLATVTGAALDIAAIQRVRTLLYIGGQDDDPDDPSLDQDPMAAAFGTTRLARVRRLHTAWDDAGIGHEYIEVPGVRHMDGGYEVVWPFLAG